MIGVVGVGYVENGFRHDWPGFDFEVVGMVTKIGKLSSI